MLEAFGALDDGGSNGEEEGAIRTFEGKVGARVDHLSCLCMYVYIHIWIGHPPIQALTYTHTYIYNHTSYRVTSSHDFRTHPTRRGLRRG
jgi:hypothetical protein